MKLTHGWLGIVLLIAFGDPGLAQQKRDLFGFKPGMTLEQAQANAMQRGIKCNYYESVPQLKCTPDVGELEVNLSDNEKKVIFVRSTFETAESPEEVAAKLSKQFGGKLEHGATKDGFHSYGWLLSQDGDLRLKFDTFGVDKMSIVVLFNAQMITDDAVANTEKRKRQRPIPKF